MYGVAVCAVFVGVLASGMTFKCTDDTVYCSKDSCAEQVEMKCQKTCKVCNDNDCSEGYFRTENLNEPCRPCKEATEADKANGTIKTYCPQCETDGKHGAACDEDCSEGCVNKKCDRWTGVCKSCERGYYGDGCIECNNCDQCSDKGVCNGSCHHGWFSRNCDSPCPTNCANGSCNTGGRCLGCRKSYFGRSCDRTCPKTCLNESCQQDDGQCTGCKDGFYGYNCTVNCSSHCLNTRCHQTNGSCVHGCTPGFYGDSCDRTCPVMCLKNSCDRSEGTCKEGCNRTGVYGPFCNYTCNGTCESVRCPRDESGDVLCSAVCITGKMGDHCTEDCPANCNGSCDHLSARCLNGCISGHYGNNCSETCSDNCLADSCFQDNGTCTSGCKPAFYGATCSKSCSENCKSPCTKKPGLTCVDGCVSGWRGSYCELRCDDNCSVCDQDTGRCTQCVHGLYGENCNRTCQDHKVNGTCSTTRGGEVTGTIAPPQLDLEFLMIILVTVFSLVIIMLLVACFLLRKKYKSSRRAVGDHTRNVSYTHTNPTYRMESDSVPTENRSDSSSDPPDILTCHVRPPPVTPNGFTDATAIVFPTNSRTNDWPNGGDDDDDDGDPEDIKYEMIFLNPQRNKRFSHDVFVNEGAVAHDMCVNEGAVPPKECLNLLYEDETRDRTPTPKPCYPHVVVSKTDIEESLPLLEPQGSRAENSVHIQHFPTYVHKMTDMSGFSVEFQYLPDVNLYSTEEADKTGNMPKNRYRNIKPYDSNRVKLETIPGIPTSDYINASFIDGYHAPRHYIATQGPIESTISDFWRMVWEVKAKYIIMLTSLQDGDQTKCSMYWPDPEMWIKKCANIVVTLEKVQVRPTYTSRRFSLSKKGKKTCTRTVTQLHYTDWVDRGIPNDGRALLSFVQYVKSLRSGKDNHPLIVHCSAGVGRTGTFIAAEYLMDQGLTEKKLDVFGCVSRLRQQRVKMVQTEAQYQFLHFLLLEWISSQSTGTVSENARQLDGTQTTV
ncbi:multiple epidermal growth factor-like domains protein 10 [Gigantopelta aegis]|uniref:multiple epidermal growth factor-like domains protein 10 n=1 Tax=Gigantopelta aegis TaxID=1735272 RepID=UPI001B88DE73|nr:multiple epidermal growth factor-like domains protein 10 [Gigantopelta aegis]